MTNEQAEQVIKLLEEISNKLAFESTSSLGVIDEIEQLRRHVESIEHRISLALE